MGKSVFGCIIWCVALISLVTLLVALGQAMEIENAEEKAQVTSQREKVITNNVVTFRPTEEVVMRLPYKPELLIKKKDLTGSIFLVNIIIYKTYYEMAEALLKYDGSSYPILWGWQTNRNGVCEIHVVEPKYVRGERILGTWGHELGHCVYGRFHK